MINLNNNDKEEEKNPAKGVLIYSLKNGVIIEIDLE